MFTLLLSNSCQDEGTVLFDIEFEVDFTTPASLDNLLTHYFPIQNVQTFFSSFAGGTSIESIGSIRSASCTIEGVFNPVDYDFIREISVFAIDPQNSANRKELFFIDPNIINGDTKLDLFSTISNHKDLLSKDIVHLEVRLELRTFAPDEYDHRLKLRFQAFDSE